MSDYFEYEGMPQSMQTCPTVGFQSAKVCLPVKVNPYTVVGPAKIHCCGQPIIMPSCNHCSGKVNGSCEFTITQKIRVEIPVEFGATVNVGDTYVDCICPKDDDYDEYDGDFDDDCDCKCDEDK